MAKMYLKRTIGGFSPADDMSVETAKKFKVGEQYRAEIVKPRSRKTLGRYWVLIDMIYSNTDMFASKRVLHDYLKIRAGHSVTIVSQSTGELYHIADSIDFDTLSEDQFQDVWSKVCDVVCADILPGITQPELENEVSKLVGVAA